MTLPTKILLAIVIVVGGSAVAFADVMSKEQAVENFTPAPPAAKASSAPDQSALTVHDEIADDQTEGGSCQINCHPVFAINQKTTLARINLDKIK